MEATTILMTEHRAIERGLTILEHCATRLESGERVPSRTLSDVLTFLKNFADKCHHGKEEGFLFPALQRSGLPKEAGPLAVMQQEHDEGRRLVRVMSEALGGVGSGDPAATVNFSRSALSFARLLRDHIGKEDNVLFVMADMRLPEEEKTRLAAEFQTAETTGEACLMKAELLDTLARLEAEISNEADTPRS